jgi:threonine synthase
MWLECGTCGTKLDDRDARTACPTCGGNLEIRRAPVDWPTSALRERFESRLGVLTGAERSGVWRYRELVLDASDVEIVSYPEGNTPLIGSARVDAWTDCDQVLLKHEGVNPTGSFKDRGMTVGVTQARRIGARAVACASTGNTAASLAAYAALAGLPAFVLVPEGQVAIGKLAQSLAYGARTLVVRGDFDDCLTLARRAAAELGVYLLNSVNPYRLEGQKTIVFELLHQLEWAAPDWIALPAGNLGNTAAFGSALRDAQAMGLITRLPRILAVQAAGAAPFFRSFRQGFRQRYRERAETIATAIRIGDPASFDRAVETMRLTNGVVAAVSDEEIIDAKACIDAAGIGCEPASAASVAGVRLARRDGVIAAGETVVCLLTGHVLKDTAILTAADGPLVHRNAPVPIEPTLAAVDAELSRLLSSRSGSETRSERH